MRVFVINLDRSVERLAAVTAHLAQRGVEWERWAAVDGQTIDGYDFDGFRAAHPAYPAYRSTDDAIRGWLGCLHSHRALAAHIADTWDGPTLILEDDARLRPRWADWSLAVDRLGGHCELLGLGYSKIGQLSGRPHGPELLGRVRGCYAYVIAERQCAVDLAECWQRDDVECDESWWPVTTRGRAWGLRLADQAYGRSDISGLVGGQESAGRAPMFVGRR